MPTSLPTFSEGRAAWVADLGRVASRDRWGVALIGAGCVHLAFFLLCQAMHAAGDRRGWHYVGLWALELATVLGMIRRVAGPGWVRATPLAGLIARVWGTVLILSFNLASLNSLSGLDHEWFKPVLCTVAAFGFMMMAYLISAWFFALAVQMSFTGMLMTLYLEYSYLIHGLSWWVALVTIGGILEARRRREAARPVPILVKIAPRGTRFADRLPPVRVDRD